jgi:hypothetical protein
MVTRSMGKGISLSSVFAQSPPPRTPISESWHGIPTIAEIQRLIPLNIPQMKKFFSISLLALALAACNSDPKPVTVTNAIDTVGLAAYQQQKARGSELDTVAKPQIVYVAAPAPKPRATRPRASAASGGSTATGTGSGTGTDAGTAAAPAKKKGISNTAKGAIIGGVAGAAGGAIINKKNRGAGALIGAVLGAGAGAVVGSQVKKGQ